MHHCFRGVDMFALQDTAIAVPFVPSTPSSNPQSQRAPSSIDSPVRHNQSTRPTDGQAVGSTPQQPPSNPQQADDSAHASTSQTSAHASSSVASASLAAAAVGTQSSISLNTATTDAAMNSHVGSSRQTMESQQQSLPGPQVDTGIDSSTGPNAAAAVQSPSCPDAQTSTAGMEHTGNENRVTPNADAQAQAAVVGSAHQTPSAGVGQPMIATALSISAKDVRLATAMGSLTAQRVSMNPQGLSPASQEGSPAAQGAGLPVQGATGAVQGSSPAATGTGIDADSQAVASPDGAQQPHAAITSVKAGVAVCLTSTADSQAGTAAGDPSSAAADVSKPNEGQEQSEGLIPAFLGTAAEAGGAVQSLLLVSCGRLWAASGWVVLCAGTPGIYDLKTGQSNAGRNSLCCVCHTHDCHENSFPLSHVTK